MSAYDVNFLDRMIAWFSPRTALRRRAARMMLGVLGDGKRSFEAVSGDRLRSDWSNITQDADASHVQSLEALRNRIRSLARNSGIVAGPLKRLTNNVVGAGIRPQARVRADGPYDRRSGLPGISEETAERFNYQIEQAWSVFVPQSDARLQQTFYEQTALAFRAMFGDGEVLAVLRSSGRPGRMVPLCIELIEIDRLRTPLAEMKNPRIRNGIEFDEEGVPVRYFVLRRHPGSQTFTGAGPDDFEALDAFSSLTGARQVLHLYDILRPGQSRGYSPLAAGLRDIQDLERYMEAEIVGARVAACLAAFVKSPSAFEQWNAAGTGTTGQKIKEFEPGMIAYLNPGEEILVHASNRPNSAFETFVYQIMLGVANAADVPYEVFANDWKDLNYSNARTVLLQAHLAFRSYQAYLITHFCTPVWESFVRDCVVAGLVEAPGFAERSRDYMRCAWIPPGWQWVDPVKEAEGKRIEIENLMDTLSNVCATMGKDFEETAETRAREIKKLRELEEKYGITFPMSAGRTAAAMDKENDDDE